MCASYLKCQKKVLLKVQKKGIPFKKFQKKFFKKQKALKSAKKSAKKSAGKSRKLRKVQ